MEKRSGTRRHQVALPGHPLQIVCAIGQSRHGRSYDVLCETMPQTHMILRRFAPESESYAHLRELHARAEGCGAVPEPLYLDGGYALYPVQPGAVGLEELTSGRARRWSRPGLCRQLETVRRIALALEALRDKGIYYPAPELKHLVREGQQLLFWDLDQARVLDSGSEEAVCCTKKSLTFLGRLLYRALMQQYPAYEPFRPEEFEETNLAAQLVTGLCTLLAVPELEKLLDIFRKCLGPRKLFLTPGELAAQLEKLEKLLRKEPSRAMAERNLDWAAADFLYRNPLYPYANTEKKELNVVLVDEGPMRDAFFEQIFASAQMLDIQLRLHLISADFTDFEVNYTIGGAYKTPALAKTVTVTRIGFQEESQPLDRDILGDNRPLAQILLHQRPGLPNAGELLALEPGCVLLFSKPTKSLRQLARELIARSRGPLLVGMSTELKLDRSGLGQNRNVNLRAFPRNGLAFSPARWEASEIYQKALNVHSYYEKDQNERISRQEILASFQDPYSMRSSVRSALSIPYKLHTCGLPNDASAALGFYEKCAGESVDQAMMDRLIWMEHRSWQAFMLTNGWDLLKTDRLSELLFASDNARLDHRDKPRKLHPCLCASHLTGESLRDWDRSRWDGDDISGLDKLDQLSVEMYRLFSRRVEDHTRADFYQLLGRIKDELEQPPLDKLARLDSSFRQLLSRVTNAPRSYRRTLSDLKDTLAPEDFARLEYFGRVLAKRNEYRNFKQSDQAVLEAIPTMLQGSPVKRMYKLFSQKQWDNVACSVYVEPEELILVADGHSLCEAEEQLPMLEAFFKLRGLQTRVTVVQIDRLCDLAPHSVLDVTGVQAQQVYAAQAHALLSTLPVIWFRDQKLQSPNNSFPQIRLCQSRRSLSIREMLALGGVVMQEGDEALLSMGQDHGLWEISQACSEDGVSFYNAAISELLALSGSSSKSLVLARSPQKNHDGWTTGLSLEEAKGIGLYDFLRNLEFQGGIKPIGKWGSGKNGTTRVVAVDPFLQKSLNSRLNSQFSAGAEPKHKYTVSVTPDPSDPTAQRIVIKTQTLNRKPETVEISGKLQKLLELLEGKGIIRPIDPRLPVYDPITKLLQFDYTSESARNAVIKHGNVLEDLAYHTIRNMDLFDDVKLSVRLLWNKDDDCPDDTENEIDLVCIKGTKSYFISCKKKVRIDAGCLTEIRYETDRFGVDGTPILLTTAKEETNRPHYTRAARMGIHVITLCDYTEAGQAPEDSRQVLRTRLAQIVAREEA